VAADYLALGEAGRIAVLRPNWPIRRLLRSPTATMGGDDQRAGVWDAAARLGPVRPGAIANYIISKAASVSDLLRWSVAAGGRPVRAGDAPRCAFASIPVRDH